MNNSCIFYIKQLFDTIFLKVVNSLLLFNKDQSLLLLHKVLIIQIYNKVIKSQHTKYKTENSSRDFRSLVFINCMLSIYKIVLEYLIENFFMFHFVKCKRKELPSSHDIYHRKKKLQITTKTIRD